MRSTGPLGKILPIVAGASFALAAPMFTTTAVASRAAHAATVRVAVLPVDGDVSAELKSDVNQQVAAALESEHYEVVEARPPKGGCKDYKCIRAVAERFDAQFVVLPAIATIDRDYGVAVRVFEAKGRPIGSEESTCEICSHEEVAESVATEAGELKPILESRIVKPYGDREQETSGESGPATLVFRSKPKGATIKIDGEKVGTTPMEVEVKPGPHDVEVTKRGFATEKRNIRAPRGEATLLRFKLAENSEGSTKALKAVAYSMSFLGLGMLGGGITLLALDERPYRRDCDGVNRDIDGRCRFRYNTLAAGASLTAVGAAAFITGISAAFIVYGRNRQKKSDLDDIDDDSISVRPIIGPTSAGLRVRF